ncbi:hypothetical protein BCY86_03680 [Pajaroellobacter abortibovis]|uniref:Uncharacterized protein n=1 Tax=Pajaroellobacter abortibovis TaxID=1882918 RepID=A0A1L6MWT8_9BACT|nr:hypothetical protein BCY86_03680 [Pajaroellobacter abortibovis]
MLHRRGVVQLECLGEYGTFSLLHCSPRCAKQKKLRMKRCFMIDQSVTYVLLIDLVRECG